MRRFFVGLFTMVLLLIPTSAFASVSTPVVSHSSATVQTATLTKAQHASVQVQPIRGGRSYTSRSYSSRSYSSRSYSSPSYNSRTGTGTRTFGTPFGGLGSHLFSFGAGFFLGHLFNPFGFGYAYGAGLSLFHILFDIVIIWVIWAIVRRMFFRR
ncbi:hypothetical protein [Alicyclobacillus acidoterrestris]|uniref:Uncharacterized protein n=1 Tax=Alicyclobacillus acidoterrestris (strain ATCC 49025 / DSM 3922 / CIP 106132 / NCIMB 13137 / GD3B) TaxID=1356854 RepID=T0BP54_ALIAG|nr:hypothetical protein [Alicyclobacillus acidoterrestris]EPZ42514.1 hypothetical protein N007_01670 [Alicyclobacillus acidoterrestris ATCC 49025]UNO49472.1 hypothetical protein K1I37_02665 [Alicyclobacillus acidoterrestris]